MYHHKAMDCFRIWVQRPENSGILTIIGLLLVLHFVALFQVEDLIYDELGTAIEANWILNDGQLDAFYYAYADSYGFLEKPWTDSAYLHHMPLGKLIVSSGVWIFGDNNIGWRVFPVLFGVASILLFYLICQRIGSGRWIPLIASFILAFDNLIFVMTGIAKYDILGLTFMLASFLCYFRNRYSLAGFLLALAALVKPTFAFGGIVILLHWLLAGGRSGKEVVRFIVPALICFIGLLPLLDYVATGEFINPWDRLGSYVDIHDDPTLAQGPAQYRALFGAMIPWDWLTSPQSIRIWQDPLYEMNVNWTLWGLIIPLMCYMLFEVIRTKGNTICVFIISWFVLGYVPWIIIYWAFDRVSYPFYFLPVVPAICLAAGYTMCRVAVYSRSMDERVLKRILQALIVCWLTADFVMFWLMAPIV